MFITTIIMTIVTIIPIKIISIIITIKPMKITIINIIVIYFYYHPFLLSPPPLPPIPASRGTCMASGLGRPRQSRASILLPLSPLLSSCLSSLLLQHPFHVFLFSCCCLCSSLLCLLVAFLARIRLSSPVCDPSHLRVRCVCLTPSASLCLLLLPPRAPPPKSSLLTAAAITCLFP